MLPKWDKVTVMVPELGKVGVGGKSNDYGMGKHGAVGVGRQVGGKANERDMDGMVGTEHGNEEDTEGGEGGDDSSDARMDNMSVDGMIGRWRCPSG